MAKSSENRSTRPTDPGASEINWDLVEHYRKNRVMDEFAAELDASGNPAIPIDQRGTGHHHQKGADSAEGQQRREEGWNPRTES